MNEVMTQSSPVAPSVSPCQIEEVFGPGLIELIRLVPRNPLVRGLILKLTGKMPPETCGTFEEVKEWIQTHCQKRTRLSSGGRDNFEDGIAITVDFSETEYGRASYSVPSSGSADFLVRAEELVEIVQAAIEGGEDLDQVVETIAGKIDEDAWSQCEPSMEPNGEYDYSEHDSTDSGSSDTSYNKAEIRQTVIAFLRERHPALAAQL
jgi:hypothetical protein